MKRTTLVTVPATVGGRRLTVTYRITVIVNTGGRNTESGSAASARGTVDAHGTGTVPAATDRLNVAWGYAEAVPVRVTAERGFDFTIRSDGDGG